MVESGFDTPLNPYRIRGPSGGGGCARGDDGRADGHYQVILLLNPTCSRSGAHGAGMVAFTLLTEEAIGLYLDKVARDGGSLTASGIPAGSAPVSRTRRRPYRHIAYLGGGHEVMLPGRVPDRARAASVAAGPPRARLVLDPIRPQKDPIRVLMRQPAAFSRLQGRPCRASSASADDGRPPVHRLARACLDRRRRGRFPDGCCTGHCSRRPCWCLALVDCSSAFRSSREPRDGRFVRRCPRSEWWPVSVLATWASRSC